MKSIRIIERVATEHKEVEKVYSMSDLRGIFGYDENCITSVLLNRIEELEKFIKDKLELD